ncbi:DNA polymerase ligase N-terminal domain-containing protein [Chitinophaga niabensis]|uniref:DNA polymerase ligase N-terminal domain-containing protein n=1 Tax=Chitinophaga niabensis TaxID=536979 RepID=UPI0031B9C3D3
MSLAKYKQKRDFKQTSEPVSGKAEGKHIFVVQRHHATRLHYDFRLEIDGALKSWAVPKGPSLNPADKRLAMEVEDHPYDYKDFEGQIPAGNYGAGYVYIWDKGTFELLDKKGNALKEWKSGSMKVVLHGKKLKGEFAIVKMKGGREENAWLLIKHKDKYAVDGEYNSEDYTPKRVIAKKKGDAEKGVPEKAAVAKKGTNKKTAAKKTPEKKATVKKAAAKVTTAKGASKKAATQVKKKLRQQKVK